MKITFLGTGTSSGVPFIGCSCKVCTSTDARDKRLRCSSLVEVGNTKILIDCGPDFRQQALANGLTHIDALLLTHEHIDHVMGIDDLRPFGNVDIFANCLTCNALRRVYSYCFNNDYPGLPSLSLHEIEEEPFTVKGIEIVPIRAMHYCLPVLGYRIGRIAYLTDLKSVADSELKKIEGVDIFVIDALRPTIHLSHPSLAEALAIIAKVNPKDAYLVHMSHDFGLHAEMENTLPKNVHIAYDGLTVECGD